MKIKDLIEKLAWECDHPRRVYSLEEIEALEALMVAIWDSYE